MSAVTSALRDGSKSEARLAADAQATSTRVAMAPPCTLPVHPNVAGVIGMSTVTRPSSPSANGRISRSSSECRGVALNRSRISAWMAGSSSS
jgi:hypothetical protein